MKILLYMLFLATVCGEPRFEVISPQVAVASADTSKGYASATPFTDGGWRPGNEMVRTLITYLLSKSGKAEILKLSPGMKSSLDLAEVSSFQVFGLTSTRKNARFVYIDVFPSSYRPIDKKLWVRDTLGGGFAQWWILLDAETGKIVDCGHKRS